MKSFIAIVLIIVGLGNNEEKVKNEILDSSPLVKEACVVCGVFDIYVRVEGKKKEVTEAVKKKIRSIKGVQRMLTVTTVQ